jgi:hypothetical protein
MFFVSAMEFVWLQTKNEELSIHKDASLLPYVVVNYNNLGLRKCSYLQRILHLP